MAVRVLCQSMKEARETENIPAVEPLLSKFFIVVHKQNVREHEPFRNKHFIIPDQSVCMGNR